MKWDQRERICYICGKTVTFKVDLQKPGFRMIDTLICPNCQYEMAESMEYEYYDVEIKEDKKDEDKTN